MKHFDEHIALPSIEEIEQYQNGLLSNERAYEIELLAQDNPMVADALEGFAMVPAFASLPDFESAVPSANAASTGINSLAKTTSPWWHLNGWIIGLTVGATIAILLGTMYNIPASANNNSVISQVQNEPLNLIADNKGEPVENVVSKKTDAPKVETTLVLNAPSETILNNTEISNKANSEDVNHVSNPRENFVSLSGINPDPEVLVTEQKIEEGIKLSKWSALQIVHIYNYRVADYSDNSRLGSWKPIEPIQSGTNASQENKNSKSTELLENDETIAIPYMEYLRQCMNEFDKGRYSSSINHFALILKQYPTDVNAQFYSSMSLYREGKYQEALDGFDAVLKNVFRGLNEEALFYKAKSLKALGRQDEAKEIFEKIIRDNGFYAADASKEI